MKISDDYKAKFRLWAANPQVIPASAPTRIPHFKSKRFASHLEMNAKNGFAASTVGAVSAREMNELLQGFNAAGIRYLLIG